MKWPLRGKKQIVLAEITWKFLTIGFTWARNWDGGLERRPQKDIQCWRGELRLIDNVSVKNPSMTEPISFCVPSKTSRFGGSRLSTA